MRQAPKLLSDLFGFGDGDMKLGIKDKLKAGGAFAMGAAIGGGATALTRNAVNAWGNIKDAKTGKDKRNAILKGIGSYSKNEKDVVMCACNNKQMYGIRRLVKEIDKKAFLVIMESNEVVGEGFKEE